MQVSEALHAGHLHTSLSPVPSPAGNASTASRYLFNEACKDYNELAKL